jgi:hypothetical protein
VGGVKRAAGGNGNGVRPWSGSEISLKNLIPLG